MKINVVNAGWHLEYKMYRCSFFQLYDRIYDPTCTLPYP